jgi:hypothetical protein
MNSEVHLNSQTEQTNKQNEENKLKLNENNNNANNQNNNPSSQNQNNNPSQLENNNQQPQNQNNNPQPQNQNNNPQLQNQNNNQQSQNKNQNNNPQSQNQNQNIDNQKKEEPYKVDSTYSGRLKEVLEKKGILRPTTIFIPETTDRTKLNQETKKKEGNKTIVYSQATLQGVKTELYDGIALFYYCKKLYIDQFYHISDMFVCCPLYYNYHISMEFDFSGGIAYHLFDTKEYSNACSHDCCPNQSREIKIELDNFLADDCFEKKTKFVDLYKKFRCACSCLCACCSRPEMKVTLSQINKEIGTIIEQQTVCSPTIYVFNSNNDLKYKIRGSCSQCGYCCKDMCCNCCKEAEFSIYSSRNIEYNKPEGKIKKVKKSGEKMRPDYEQIELDFPLYANCYDKILLMSATIFLNMLYFQNIKNSNRCNGGPID